jgi:hypothetical protein
MLDIIITIILVSAFFILFFKPTFDLENKREERLKKASTIDGFIEDTYRDPFIDRFIPPEIGDIGTFSAYSSIPEDNWLHGFPHEKA